jgi:hypothetical protein
MNSAFTNQVAALPIRRFYYVELVYPSEVGQQFLLAVQTALDNNKSTYDELCADSPEFWYPKDQKEEESLVIKFEQSKKILREYICMLKRMLFAKRYLEYDYRETIE